MYHLLSFNRTIVELKLKLGVESGAVHPAFNRTIVELKQNSTLKPSIKMLTFNRTIVELKQGKQSITHFDLGLLIEPLWN